MNKEVLKVLKAGRALISKPENWIQGNAWLNSQGELCQSSEATCFCSWGALTVQTHLGKRTDTLKYAAMCYLEKICKTNIITYNDTHTHSEVLAVWDNAIAKLEQELSDAS